MKNFIFKSMLATCVAGIAIVCTPKSSVAQVDMSLLTEVANSCQRDANSPEYYRQLGHTKHEIDLINDDWTAKRLLSHCIRSRYIYSLTISKFPWLASAGDMKPGYPASVAIAQLTRTMGPEVIRLIGYSEILEPSKFLDCLISQTGHSKECKNSNATGSLYKGNGSISRSYKFNLFNNYQKTSDDNFFAFTSPSYYVNYNHHSTGEIVVVAFIEWFMKLKPHQRRELMSILGEEEIQKSNRKKMQLETHDAWDKYREIRQKVAEEDKERRRRELFGE